MILEIEDFGMTLVTQATTIPLRGVILCTLAISVMDVEKTAVSGIGSMNVA